MAARAVLDEFTAPAEKAALLERSRGRIEGLFGVSLAVLGALGAEEPLPARIWLQLRGAQEAVHSAKVSPPPPPRAGLPHPRPPWPSCGDAAERGAQRAASGARGPASSAREPCDLGLAV